MREVKRQLESNIVTGHYEWDGELKLADALYEYEKESDNFGEVIILNSNGVIRHFDYDLCVSDQFYYVLNPEECHYIVDTIEFQMNGNKRDIIIDCL
jgi:hypothetical protein